MLAKLSHFPKTVSNPKKGSSQVSPFGDTVSRMGNLESAILLREGPCFLNGGPSLPHGTLFSAKGIQFKVLIQPKGPPFRKLGPSVTFAKAVTFLH